MLLYIIDSFLGTYLYHYNTCIPLILVKQNLDQHKITLSPELSMVRETLGLLKDSCAMYPMDIELQRVQGNYTKFYIEQCEKTAQARNCNRIRIELANNKPRATWNIINNETGKTRKGTNTTEAPTCEAFNIFFTTVAENLRSKLPSVQTTSSDAIREIPVKGSAIFFYPTTSDDIITTTNRLKTKRTKDCYDIDVETLKFIISSIAQPLEYIFNCCIGEGVFPERLKISKIVPIFKKGSHDNVSNYRPIAILPAFSKIFEAMLVTRIVNFLDQNHYPSDEQFGFRSNLGTTDALMQLTRYVAEALESGEQCRAVFCDLSKAFDCMCHTTLIDKLTYYGFRGQPLKLVKSYLTGRRQYVSHQNQTSAQMNTDHGIPQGSLIGPLLFIIYMNDLPSNIRFTTLMYADDTTLLIRDRDENTLNFLGMEAKQEAAEWFAANKLTMNIDKTTEIQFTNNTSSQHPSEKVKILGIFVFSFMTWRPHIESMLETLPSAIYAIKRTARIIHKEAARTVYICLVSLTNEVRN